mmetsp:Transcript_131342/g.379960  ORF Transcript_131342/g.379960 Transcript_131342/m.379960 type:complete len:204 (+) Transcript_131342:1322-1933(+)
MRVAEGEEPPPPGAMVRNGQEHVPQGPTQGGAVAGGVGEADDKAIVRDGGGAEERGERPHLPRRLGALANEQPHPRSGQRSVLLKSLGHPAQCVAVHAQVRRPCERRPRGPCCGGGRRQHWEGDGVGEVVLLQIREGNDSGGPQHAGILERLTAQDGLAHYSPCLSNHGLSLRSAQEFSELLLGVEVLQLSLDKCRASWCARH